MPLDEQVGNNSYLTMTPGSAVAGQLQDILTRKRLQARQNMLDDLNRRNTESEMKYREENAAGLREQREGMAAQRKATADKMFLDRLGDNPMEVDPATAAKLQEIAPTRLKTTPVGNTLPSVKSPLAGVLAGANPASAPAQAGPTEDPSQATPASAQYLGSPAYVKQHETELKIEALAKDPNFSKLPAEQQLLKISQIFPNVDPTAVFERLLTSKTQQAPGNFMVYDEATGTMKNMGPRGPNDSLSIIPRAPKETPERPTWAGNTADGKPVFLTNKLNKLGLPSLMLTDGTPYDGPITKVGTNSGVFKSPVSAQEGKEYARLLGKATDGSGFLGMSGKKATEGDKQAFHQYESYIYGKFPNLAELAKNIVKSETDPAHTNEAIVEHALSDGVIEPAEKDPLYALLQVVRPS